MKRLNQLVEARAMIDDVDAIQYLSLCALVCGVLEGKDKVVLLRWNNRLDLGDLGQVDGSLDLALLALTLVIGQFVRLQYKPSPFPPTPNTSKRGRYTQ